jgi:hypothetical protein
MDRVSKKIYVVISIDIICTIILGVDKSYKKEYNQYIIQHSTISNYSVQNQRDIVLDIADNLTQIGQWTLENYSKEQSRIELFLNLTRKNLNALMTFPLSPAFEKNFKKFCDSYEKLDAEYKAGLTDKKTWANGMISWGTSLTQSATLV